MNMDEILHKKRKSLYRPITIVSVAAVVMVLIGYKLLASSAEEVAIQALQIETVKRGDLNLVVKGFGTLKARKKRVLTAAGAATVEEVLLYPGAEVQSDTVIAILYNPALEQQLKEAEAEYRHKLYEFHEYELVLQAELWELEAEIKKLELETQNLVYINESKTEMAAKGIISKLDFRETQTELGKTKLLLELSQNKQQQMTQIHKQRLDIKQDGVKLAADTVQMYRDRVEQNRVKAGMVGILQELHVEVGQSVVAGGNLALVGGIEDLIAEIKVPQREANQVSVGDSVDINTFGDKGTGIVSRIDPVVSEGKILIEINLTGSLPSNARPELSVEGSIIVNQLEDVLFVPQFSQIAPNSTQQLFVVDNEGKFASKTSLVFGDASGQYIQIKQGVGEGDQLVIKVPDSLQAGNRINLTQ